MSTIAVWDFRANEDLFENPEAVMAWLNPLAKKWAFQREQGDSGYKHWQGRMSLHKPRRKAELLKLLNTADVAIPQYLQPTSKDVAQKGNLFYVLKLDSRIEGPWTDKDVEQWMCPDWDLPKTGWYPFQQTILDSREIRDKRTINLVLDPHGNNGKTHLAMYIELKKLGLVVPALSDAKEILECVCDELMADEDHDPKLVIVDLPRAMSKKTMAGMFSALEQIKNGKAIDRRYKYRKWFFRPPQMWVFTNRWPNMAYLSADRWRAWSIIDGRFIPTEITESQRDDDAIDEEDFREIDRKRDQEVAKRRAEEDAENERKSAKFAKFLRT